LSFLPSPLAGTARVHEWLGRIDKDAKDARDRRIFDMWMACHADKEIGEAVDLTGRAVAMITEEMADLPRLPKPAQSAASHSTDFDPPLYKVWKQQQKKGFSP
jgi:hypothetical protein